MPDDICYLLDKIGTIGYHSLAYDKICQDANEFYRNALGEFKMYRDKGKLDAVEYKRLREFFRGVLPQHNMTERVTIMNLRSWANFYRLRSKSDAQLEIQTIAKLMHDQVLKSDTCPIAIKALSRNNWSI